MSRLNLVAEISLIPNDSDKIKRLSQAIREREQGTTEALLFLWETLPRDLWEKANSEKIFSEEEWTACLTFLSKWFKKNQNG